MTLLRRVLLRRIAVGWFIPPTLALPSTFFAAIGGLANDRGVDAISRAAFRILHYYHLPAEYFMSGLALESLLHSSPVAFLFGPSLLYSALVAVIIGPVWLKRRFLARRPIRVGGVA
jgi:hypothetical protein